MLFSVQASKGNFHRCYESWSITFQLGQAIFYFIKWSFAFIAGKL